MDSDKRPAKGLHAWTVAQGDQVKQVNSYKQVKTVASAKALNDIHAQLQNKNKGGASSSLAVHQALDTSDHSLASRVAKLKDAKGVVNTDSGLETFEIPTLLLHSQTKAANQRILNESHVEELIVRSYSRPFKILLLVSNFGKLQMTGV